MAGPDPETCGTCKCFKSLIEHGVVDEGLCRLEPPTTMVTGMLQDAAGRKTPETINLFRTTRRDGWCSKWMPKPTEFR